MQLDAVASHQSPLSVILLFVVFVGFSDGIAQGAIFGDVALLPPKYTQVCLPSLIMLDRLLDYLVHLAWTDWLSCFWLSSHDFPSPHITVSAYCAWNKWKSIPEGKFQEPSVK